MMTETRKQKLEQAKEFLGNKWVLHPDYKGGHRYTEATKWTAKKKATKCN